MFQPIKAARASATFLHDKVVSKASLQSTLPARAPLGSLIGSLDAY